MTSAEAAAAISSLADLRDGAPSPMPSSRLRRRSCSLGCNGGQVAALTLDTDAWRNERRFLVTCPPVAW